MATNSGPGDAHVPPRELGATRVGALFASPRIGDTEERDQTYRKAT